MLEQIHRKNSDIVYAVKEEKGNNFLEKLIKKSVKLMMD